MHLKSISLKGFKSFPDRTELDFGSGVSVIVGPNGSGKSNVTDAVLWALGEQSPLAVRGQTMQDVIFAGGEGVKGRNAAEVEIVIDNSDGYLRSDFSELSISRRVDRSGEGIYRLNGARCRLVDVQEALSDSGLGKEMHSVISQGRVEAIVHSKPGDRTVLIEEAAGLSKHRKRRHRAQLKLERTRDNLDRALDVEREARSRLRPLKRQAEAAELHARIERQRLEVRARLTEDDLRSVRGELEVAERSAGEARQARESLEAQQAEASAKRERAEQALATHGRERELLAGRFFATRSARERIELRLESVERIGAALATRLERSGKALSALGELPLIGTGGSRAAELERELARLDQELNARLASELRGIEQQREAAEARASELERSLEQLTSELEDRLRDAERGRERGRRALEATEHAARELARLEVGVGALDERLRSLSASSEPTLSDRLEIDRGWEAAVAGALGERMSALVAEDIAAATSAVMRSEDERMRVLVKGQRRFRRSTAPPVRGAERLLDHVRCDGESSALVELLLADAWMVERLGDLPDDFEGIAVTREGVSYHGQLREVLRPSRPSENAASTRARKGQLEAQRRELAERLDEARAETEAAAAAVHAAEEARDALEAESRTVRRSREEALEDGRRASWLIERRREGGDGQEAVRRSRLAAELEAERRFAERMARERDERDERVRRLESGVQRDRALLPEAERLAVALRAAIVAVTTRTEALEGELAADTEAADRAAGELRGLAQSEYELQARLREAGEVFTREEVRVAQVRDREAAVSSDLAGLLQRLGVEPEPGAEPLTDEARSELESRLERLERRRERIGPVNPLAETEYNDALEHVEDLERQREDLEAALAELQSLIRDTDRRIRESFDETFEATRANFEEIIRHLFPGGGGKLRLVKPPAPRLVLGGAEPEAAGLTGPEDVDAGEGGAEADDLAAAPNEAHEAPGVEIEVTPAGKSTKRLSLLSGGEKSLVALGFLFAVFLARPCPFYILDEVEAALDDLNIDRFLALVRRYAERSQFIIITHQRRTMEAADVLYGVSMGRDGVSKVISRRFERGRPDSPDPEERLTEAA